MKEDDGKRNYGDGNARNDKENVLYAERLKLCDQCKMPVNVCLCESVFAKSSYDSRNDRRKESLSVTNRYNLRFSLSKKVSSGCSRTTYGRMHLVGGNRQCFDRSSL